MFKTYFDKYKKLSCWSKIIIISIFVVIIVFTMKKYKIRKEGFTQRDKYVKKKNIDAYDAFYSEIYDDLVYNNSKNIFEIDEVKRILPENDDMKALDIGSGTGHHVHLLNLKGIDTIGVDASPSMIEKAKELYPKWRYDEGNVKNSMLYPSNTFDLITCFYFTLYYFKDKVTFFKNCAQWVKPNGILVIHLVNRDEFNPILPAANPLSLVSVQKYAKNRITNSLVKFKDFQYKANFDTGKDVKNATFKEILKDDVTGHIRENVHEFDMPTQKYILSLASDQGFKLKGRIDLTNCLYEYQYLYVLQKEY